MCLVEVNLKGAESGFAGLPDAFLAEFFKAPVDGLNRSASLEAVSLADTFFEFGIRNSRPVRLIVTPVQIFLHHNQITCRLRWPTTAMSVSYISPTGH